MKLLKANAKIQGSKSGQKPGWFSLRLDNDFSYYYRWFTWTKWNLPLNGCHITFIAGDRESRIVTLDEMKPYLEKEIWFEYDPIVYTNGESFWIDCQSEQLDQIRKNLNLGNRFRDKYHITLGNFKNVKS